MKQNTLYNLCLTWSQKMKPNNNTCRHGLCTSDAFTLEDDGYDSVGGRWYRLSRRNELRKKDKNSDNGQERDQEEVVKRMTKMTPPDRILKPQEMMALGYKQETLAIGFFQANWEPRL
jgi:hypothetical protein